MRQAVSAPAALAVSAAADHIIVGSSEMQSSEHVHSPRVTCTGPPVHRDSFFPDSQPFIILINDSVFKSRPKTFLFTLASLKTDPICCQRPVKFVLKIQLLLVMSPSEPTMSPGASKSVVKPQNGSCAFLMHQGNHE